MMKEKLLETLDHLYESYLSVWEDVCNTESPTAYKEGVDAVGNYFIKVATERGWKVEVCKQEVSGDVVCITMNPESTEKPIALSGHMDTVHQVGSFGTPAVHRDSEKIYGPGVTDCKGGLVSALYAMDVLHQCGYSKRPIMLLLQSDEESSSDGSDKATVRYMCEKAKDAIAFLNLERNKAGEICLVRKGILNVTFHIIGQEAHASNCATVGANAIAEAAYKIIELEKFKDVDGITCCCSIINGGTTDNTVPGECTLKANFRFATYEQLEYIKEFTKTLAETSHIPGCTCTVEYSRIRHAMELNDKNHALFEAMNRIFVQNGMPTLQMGSRKGGSDAADVTVFGIPCVDSIGVVGDYIHTKNEFAYLNSLKEAAKRIVVVACDL